MQKSILFALLCGVAVFAVACGGGNNSGNGKPSNGGGSNSAEGGNGGDSGKAAEDMMAFYRKAGNYYLAKSTSKMSGTENVSYMKVEVVKSDDKGYVTKTTMMDKDKKEIMAGTESPLVEWPKTDGTAVKTDTPAPKVVEEELEVAGKKYNCIKVETDMSGTKSTSWSYKGVPMKSVSKSDQMESTMEVVELKLE